MPSYISAWLVYRSTQAWSSASGPNTVVYFVSEGTKPSSQPGNSAQLSDSHRPTNLSAGSPTPHVPNVGPAATERHKTEEGLVALLRQRPSMHVVGLPLQLSWWPVGPRQSAVVLQLNGMKPGHLVQSSPLGRGHSYAQVVRAGLLCGAGVVVQEWHVRFCV